MRRECKAKFLACVLTASIALTSMPVVAMAAENDSNVTQDEAGDPFANGDNTSENSNDQEDNNTPDGGEGSGDQQENIDPDEEKSPGVEQENTGTDDSTNDQLEGNGDGSDNEEDEQKSGDVQENASGGITYDNEYADHNEPSELKTSADPDSALKGEVVTNVQDFDTLITCLKDLETYAETYASENSEDAYALELNYIRTGVERYTDSLWAGVAGEENTAFVEYVSAQDSSNGTSASALRDIELLDISNGNEMDFGHLFAVLDIAYHQKDIGEENAQKYADFGGWLGDLVDLLSKCTEVDCTDMEAAVLEIRENYLGTYLGAGSFDERDMRADMDAVYFMDQKAETESAISDLLVSYYTSALSDNGRATFFVENRYPGKTTIKALRKAIYTDYTGNLMAGALEAKRGIDGSDYDNQRMAVCYAWSDYLCDKAGITEIGTDDPDQPENPDQPDQPDNPYDSNQFYSVFSSTTTTLAPGVTQTIKYANTVDDKQMVYYIATADVTRDDVTINAGYKDYDATSWGMQSVTDQIAAAEAAHADDPNYNVVAGVNADFFSMSTGEPTGPLVMEGVEYHPDNRNNAFFGILKDGTPMIGSASDYEANKDNIQEAVGVNTMLVRDGESCVTTTSNYYNSRASRTCVGITADNEVVLMVLDGRQEPFSCGGSTAEIAQIMVDAGCVIAGNLDGGGSSTFAAKPEGSNDITVVNRPSDGFERRVSTSLMVISGAIVSNEFDHAAIKSESQYIAPGSSLIMEATGVSSSGNAADIPEGSIWTVDDETIAEIAEDGTFTAKSVGDVNVNLMHGDTSIGSIEMHVVIPDGLSFSTDEVTAVYGSTIKMPLIATYNGNVMVIAEDSDLLFWATEKQNCGTFSGQMFTAADEECGVRSTLAGCALADDYSVYAKTTIYFYKSGEAVFDFNDATSGDRILAWKRDVSNSTTGDEITYFIDDPDLEMDVSYVFALDMNDLQIPENVAQALPLVAAFMGEGQVDGSTSAWELLLMLAERISPSTTVTVSIDVDPKLELDLSEMFVNCEYFELTDTIYDNENNKIELICNWIKVDGPIDPGTANPLCIVSGIKARVKDDVDWGSNHQISLDNSGGIYYMARLRSSQAYSIAGSNFGQQFGLKPYDNSANLINDKGAEFSSTHAEFEDKFNLNNTDLEGWIETEEGSLFYYIKNKKVTGIKCVPNQEGTADLYYDFGNEGVCKGKYSGFLTEDDKLMYLVLGEPKTGWREIDGSNYYFDKKTYEAVNGVQTIDGFTYTFEDYKLVKGQLYKAGEYWKYRWAGRAYRNGWFELDGKKYCAASSEKLRTGLAWTDPYGGGESTLLHVFDENGVWLEDYSGFYTYNGEVYLVDKGIVSIYPGLVKIDDDYYYFKSDNIMVRGRSYWITKTNNLMPEKAYTFEEDGKMVIEQPPVDPDEPDQPTVKNGIVSENGSLWYYVDGKITYVGLIEIDGAYYYVRTSGEVVHGRSYWCTRTNGLMPEKAYTFDGDGKMVIETPPVDPDEPDQPVEPTAKNGIVVENGSLWYYVNDKLTYAGLIEVDGEYYYVRTSGELVHGRSYWITKTNGLMPEKAYTFDDDGKMVIEQPPVDPDEPDQPTVKNGIVSENGSLWYYVDGKITYVGLIEIDGAYYYVRTSGEVVHGRSYWCTRTNGLMPEKAYTFDDDGKMVQ